MVVNFYLNGGGFLKRAFLSHNVADKEYVSRVAKELGYNGGIIDSSHFKEGYDFREQIKNYLKQSDIFVLFASKESLNAPWVKYEMNLAELAILNRDVSNILVLLVDKDLKHSDLPDWLQYSLVKYVETPKIAANMIQSFLEENSHRLYIGRGQDHEKFDNHYFSSDKDARNLVFFGLNGIGRRSFAKQVIKHNFNQDLATEYEIEESAPLIALYRDLLIDFFVISDVSDFEISKAAFESLSLENQVNEILKYLIIFSKHKQVPVFVDNGGMLDSEGMYKTEIIELMKKINETDNLFVAYIQNRNPRGYEYINLYFVSYVPELTSESTEHFLRQYCNSFFNLSLSKNECREVSQHIGGYPPTVEIAANEINRYGIDFIIANPRILLRYNSGAFDNYLEDVVEKKDEYLLKLLNNFGGLNLTVIMSLIDEPLESVYRLVDLSVISVSNESKIYYVSNPISSAIGEKFGIFTRQDYKKIALILKEKYKTNDIIPDIRTLDVMIFSILRAEMDKELEEFQSLILPSDLLKSAKNAYHYKDWATARNLFGQLLKLDSDNISAVEFMIRSKIRLNENTDEDFIRLKRLSKEKYTVVLAFKKMKETKFDAAIELYEEVRSKGYTPPSIYRDLGECYYQTDQPDKVQSILNEGLIKTKFKNRFMLDLAAKNAIKQDKFTEAESYIDYLEKVDNQGSVMHRKASLKLKEGNLREAEKYASLAVQEPNSRSEFFFLLANIYINLGELEKADSVLKKTIEQFSFINIKSDSGYLNLKCLYYIKKENLKKSKEYLSKINSQKDFLELQFYKLVLKDFRAPLPDRIEAEQKIEKLEKKEYNTVVVDV